MIEYQNLIYLDLQKTGSTHIRHLLNYFCTPIRYKQHSRITKHQHRSGKKIFSTIRDPFEWWVSCWAFGFVRKGRFYRGLGGDPSIYSYPADPEGFRKFVRVMNDYRSEEISVLGEGYTALYAMRFGFYTWRLINLTCARHGEVLPLIPDPQEYFGTFHLTNIFLMQEALNEEFIGHAPELGLSLAEEDISWIKSQRRTNSSKHPLMLQEYYDEETQEIVRQREAAIFNIFGYGEELC